MYTCKKYVAQLLYDKDKAIMFVALTIAVNKKSCPYHQHGRDDVTHQQRIRKLVFPRERNNKFKVDAVLDSLRKQPITNVSLDSSKRSLDARKNVKTAS